MRPGRGFLISAGGGNGRTASETCGVKDAYAADTARQERKHRMSDKEKLTEKKHPTVDVIIPVYRPDRRLARLLRMLEEQTYPAGRIIIINTERRYWNESGFEGIAGLEVRHISRREFDHGGTRNLGASLSRADVLLFMTDDAVPRNDRLIESLVRALERKGPGGETAAMAYARQMPAPDCRAIESYTRNFNYPAQGRIKTAADLPKLGIKTFFASNVCCAYRRDIFEKLGGFINRTIFNEDMIYASGAVRAGYAVVYAAEAEVVHSHNLTLLQQFRRNFDLGVSQADHPEVFAGVSSESEGIRLVKQTAAWLLRTGRPWLLPLLAAGSGSKVLGYWLGRRYRRLPTALILQCTSNRQYWMKEKGEKHV